MKRMAVVVTCTVDPDLNNDVGLTMLTECLDYLNKNTSDESDVWLIDNGSEVPINPTQVGAKNILRLEHNKGINHVFHSTIDHFKNYEFIAHMHNDLMVVEQDWDTSIIMAFDVYPKLALIGFVGSNEIDAGGGRGGGTHTSYMGYKYKSGEGSAAEIHGARTRGVVPAAVLDHCAMIWRRTVLAEIPSQDMIDIAPHHFGDRIWCCEVLKAGYHIAMMGIQCDHFGGGSALGIKSRHKMYEEWMATHPIPYDGAASDYAVYHEAEKIFLDRYREQTHFIPLKVLPDYTVVHLDKRYQ